MPNRSRQMEADPLPPPHMGEGCRRSGEDLISGLPDELLHCILVRLRCARAAARTSVLSRRWRHVWAHLPELLLYNPASSPDTVDGALAGYLAPGFERLAISLPADTDPRVLAGRAVPWLRFAAERVSGELRLHVPVPRCPLMPVVPLEEAKLDLPACGRAQRIALFLGVKCWLRLRPAGLFSALTELVIYGAHMEGVELSHLVCTLCPRLSCLHLLVTLVTASNVTIRSGSLRSLWFSVLDTQRLELVAPRLEKLEVYQSHRIQAHISAPKLAQLVWKGSAYEPCNHLFPDVCSRLGLLQMGLDSACLMQRFDEVDVLKLRFWIPQGIVGYQGFLNETKRLPKCKTLNISLLGKTHELAATVLHLLRSCNGTRKLLLTYYNHSSRTCLSSCPCCLEESRRIDGIDLSSLSEVEISSLNNFHEGLEFVELLFRCNANALKKLVMSYKGPDTPETNEVCEKVCNMCPPNVKVEFLCLQGDQDSKVALALDARHRQALLQFPVLLLHSYDMLDTNLLAHENKPAVDLPDNMDGHGNLMRAFHQLEGADIAPGEALCTFLKSQLAEIAVGLENSGERFLWVVRSSIPPGAEDDDLDLLLPTGFRERTVDRGFVVRSWAPQAAVLRHPAAGAFVTHCGWNSTLEGVAAGLPLLCWPLYAEQRMNRVRIVEDMGLGVEVAMDDDGKVKAEELEEKVRWVMGDSDGARALREHAAAAEGPGGQGRSGWGASDVAFVEFLKDLLAACQGMG